MAKFPLDSLHNFPRKAPGGPWRCCWTGYSVGGTAAKADVVLTYEVTNLEHRSSMQGYIQGLCDGCGQHARDPSRKETFSLRLYVTIIRTSTNQDTLHAAL